MPTSSSGISYEELSRGPVGNESAKEDYRHDKISAVRILKAKWSDRIDLVRDLMGGVSSVGGALVYVAPDTYPEFDKCFVRGISVQGITKPLNTGPESMANYEFAELRVMYETPDLSNFADDPTSTNLISESVDLSGEFITIPESSLWWVSSGKELKHQAGLIIGAMDYTLMLHRHPAPPFGAALNLVGKVNSTPFSPIGSFTFAADHLLFLGLHSARNVAVSATGKAIVTAWDVAYKFKWRSKSWNEYFNRDLGGWDRVVTASGSPPYDGGNFATLY